MPPTIYWNELSLPVDVVLEELHAGGAWALRAKNVFDALNKVWEIQPRARVSVNKGQLHEHIFDRPILSWLEIWLGRDQVRRLKGTRLIQSENEVVALLNEFECEVKLAETIGEGLTRAHIAKTWVWSLGNAITTSNNAIINAQEVKLDDNGEIKLRNVSIKNLADVSHYHHWQQDIAAWDQTESTSCIVGKVAGNDVLMYPFDHGYPHVHVKVAAQPKSVFKYRIDFFAPLVSSEKALDAALKEWITANAISLNESWRRCQKGKHPLKIN